MTFEELFPEIKKELKKIFEEHSIVAIDTKRYEASVCPYLPKERIASYKFIARKLSKELDCFSKSWIIKQIKEIQKDFEKENWKKQYTTKGGLRPLIPYLHVQTKIDELLERLKE